MQEPIIFKTKEVKLLHCLRCGAEWEPRFPDRIPKTCNVCNSTLWNKPRIRKQRSKPR